jgi:succinate dehydrogenase / fumarate reductase cytochrome b subunit
MPSLIKALNSQVGRKIVTAITGIGLMLFLISHLAGNLTIFGDSEAFNIYTYTLESLGPLLYIAEAGLAFFFLYHAIMGISIWRQK